MDNFEHPKDGYVFIITYGRSGSTLLQNVLNSIPGYQIRGENNNLLFHFFKAYQAAEVCKPLRGMRRAKSVSDPTHPWFGGENIDPDEFGAEMAALFTRTVLKPDPGIRCSGFKEIRFQDFPASFPFFLRFIRRFFPNARFIFNTRDHARVAKSGWWSRSDPEQVSKRLAQAEELFATYLDAHPDHAIAVHYDDYVADRDAFIPLFDFLGEDYRSEQIVEVMEQRLEHARGREVDHEGKPRLS